VHAINLVTREAFKESLGQHASGTAQPLFGGLKDHHGGAVEIAGCGQVARRPEQHGCMPVMPTGMHGAGVGGGIGQGSDFLDGQCIHIGAQADAAVAGLSPPDQPNNAGAADPRMHLVDTVFL